MRYSQSFAKTQKEIPKDATIASHQLLVRAGFIHQIAAGLYDFLPMGFTVLMKIDHIIRDELSKKGVQHLLMPFVHPASLWKESKRYDKFDVLQKFKAQRGVDYVLAPTHEETVTDLARKFITTYKDLPAIVNQNQWKYRDEMRATGGLLRTREFLMQDAYSFDKDEDGLAVSFDKISEAYQAIFDRLGVDVALVKADSGAMGGSASEEFMVFSDIGEDKILVCDKCEYKANMEKADSKFKTFPQDKEQKPMEKVEGKGLVGVEPLAKHLGIEVHQTTKTLLFQADDKVVAVMIRGDYDVNETKLRNHLGCDLLALASENTVKELTGAEIGYAGPINLPDDVQVIADLTCKDRTNFEAGANETDFHNVNVNFETDFPIPQFVDLRESKEGDGCNHCDGGHLKIKNAIEIAHVFKLGTTYSDSMKANFIDSDGKGKPLQMGCYGLGITRLVAAIVEVSNDENGIIWPKSVAPYHVSLVSIGKDDAVKDEADRIYEELLAEGIEVLYDDRNEGPGLKLKDSDLMGIPLRLVVSNRTMESDSVEWKARSEKDAKNVAIKDVLAEVKNFLSE